MFIIALMLLAVKSHLYWIAGLLFLLLLVTAKSKYLLLAALVGGALAAALALSDLGDYSMWVIVGALFLVVLLISRKEAEHPSPEGYYGMGPGGYY